MNFKQLLLLLLIAPLPAIAAEKHVHGEAQLSIAIEGHQILIELESPADNILGFEHAPNTKEQKILLSDSLKILETYTNLITFDAVNCKQIGADVNSPFDKHHDNAHDKHHDHADSNHDGHSEFHLSYSLECEKPVTISKAKITAFAYFKGFKKIQANWVTTTGQGSQIVSPKNPMLEIR
jgi:hypothetical protein